MRFGADDLKQTLMAFFVVFVPFVVHHFCQIKA